MNQKNFTGLICLIFICFILTVCDTPADGGGDGPPLINLQTYKNVGASVAEKEWTENYDCSNFSTQFYQNCYKAGLPCRVRLGRSGGRNFSEGDHAWNSVKINGTWVNWEPQANDVYNYHRQTKTPLGSGWGNFTKEDIARIIYESVGKYVPKEIIDAYEIDKYWNDKSPFYKYFVSQSDCLSDGEDPGIQNLVLYLEGKITANNSGDIFIDDRKHLFLFFKYNDKYYGIANIEESDPVEGRSATGRNTLKEIIRSSTEFTQLETNIYYNQPGS